MREEATVPDRYKSMVNCPRCLSRVSYHVTDLKGVEPPYIVCPNCHKRVNIYTEKANSKEENVSYYRE